MVDPILGVSPRFNSRGSRNLDQCMEGPTLELRTQQDDRGWSGI